MGSHPYYYFTPYKDDIQTALQELRDQEFKAGRYDPAMQSANPPSYMFQFKFPPDASSPAPGAQHHSIDDAVDAAMESGTGSILDLMRISDGSDYHAACPLSEKDLTDLFGTSKPSRDLVESVLIRGEKNFGHSTDEIFWQEIDRGQGRYIVLYDGDKPSEIFFLGFSFD